MPAINRGLQAAGRVIRAESEHGVLLFCDRRFGGSGLGSVNQFLPEWVRGELIVVNAARGLELIREKVAEWGMERPAVKNPERVEAAKRIKKNTNPGRSRTNDLKDIVKKLGLDKPVIRKGQNR